MLTPCRNNVQRPERGSHPALFGQQQLFIRNRSATVTEFDVVRAVGNQGFEGRHRSTLPDALILGSSNRLPSGGERHKGSVDNLFGKQVEHSVEVVNASGLTELIDPDRNRSGTEHTAHPGQMV